MRSRLGESLHSVAQAPALADVTTASLAALRAYTQGVQAGDAEGDWERGFGQLKEAVRLDSTFAQAWRKMAAYATNIGRPSSEQLNAASKAYQNRERLQGDERLEVEAYYLQTLGSKPGIDAYRRAPGASQNNRAVALYNIGRFAEADSVLVTQQATDSAKGRPAAIQTFVNRVASQIGLRQFPTARQLVAEMQKRFPGAYYTEWGGAIVDWTEGGLDSLPGAAARLKQSQQPLSRADGAEMFAADAGARGQFRTFTARARAARLVNDSAAGNGDAMRAALWTVVPAAVHRSQEAHGVSTLDSLLKVLPQANRPTLDRKDLELATAYAQLGRADKARLLVTEWARVATGPEQMMRWAAWRGALGEVALAEGHTAEALKEFRLAADADSGILESVTNGLTAARMARAFDKAGQADSAIAWYEHVAHVRNFGSYLVAPLNLPVAYRRLGELYEARGDTLKALDNYRAFTRLWANADAELQPQVADVKRRIERLFVADARKR